MPPLTVQTAVALLRADAADELFPLAHRQWALRQAHALEARQGRVTNLLDASLVPPRPRRHPRRARRVRGRRHGS